MPKLLSQSKHEEFESDLALQIRDEKERRIDNAKNLELQEIHTHTIHAADTIHPTATVHLLFDASYFCYNFLFLPILSLVIAFGFDFFGNFPCSEHYISSVKLL